MNFYKVEGLPYFAIIDPRTGESMKVWRHTPKQEELLSDFATFLDTYSLDNFRAVNKRKAGISVGELTEEEQLNLAIAASLGGGGESSTSPSDKVIQVDDEEKIIVDEWQKIPNTIGPETTAPAGQVTRLQFKLPDGSRIVHKFLKSDTVRHLFSFIKVKLAEKNVVDKFELLNFRDALFPKLDETLEEAKVLNSSLIVELNE
ncbi:hypothetical protein HK100_010598 [Physocladia obscura]|uniref:UBX domain-containing protein n=1 Tax=Physocladia obscura TaxID=109957 RepID=A0AAD5X9A8_9FUNG|nr:hypothetical protein HK100_010598 [Physocladia obscura]